MGLTELGHGQRDRSNNCRQIRPSYASVGACSTTYRPIRPCREPFRGGPPHSCARPRGEAVRSRVLVTGGAGFIGSHAALALTRRGHDVRVLDLRRTAGVPGDVVIGDVRDADAVDAALAGVDAVCHLAAKVGLGVDVQDLPDYASATTTAPACCSPGWPGPACVGSCWPARWSSTARGSAAARSTARLPPARVSAAALNRGEFEPPCPRCGRPLAPALVSEDAPIDPRNGYAASKVAQEQFAASWARATGGPVAALRYHNVYGPGMPRDTPYAGVAAIFTSALRTGRAAAGVRGRWAAAGLRPRARRGRGGRGGHGAAAFESVGRPRRAAAGVQRRIGHAAHGGRSRRRAGRGVGRPGSGRHRRVPARRRPAHHRRLDPAPGRTGLAAEVTFESGVADLALELAVAPDARP